jgi:hypothetical protein
VLTVFLDCLSSFCFLCSQCLYFLSIVCLRPVSCVPSVDSASRLFASILFLVCPVFTSSLDCLSSSCIFCAHCQKYCQHWGHNIQDEEKQSRDTVNTGHTRNRTKKSNGVALSTLGTLETYNPETWSTLGTQDTEWKQTI